MASRPMLRQCPLCGGKVAAFRGRAEVVIGGRTVSVADQCERCSDCGERFYAPGQMELLEQRAAAAIRAEDGLLTPSEIRAIRERLGLSQAGLEQLLGVGAKTVVRWERGSVVPNRATDNLLRIVGAVPGAAAFLRKQNLRDNTKRETGRSASKSRRS